MRPDQLHLVILRGNSGSGKTTLARRLQVHMGRGTANVGQDHLRRVVLREHDVPGGDNITLIEETVRTCTRLGYHVICEGILFAPHYREMLIRLLDAHPGRTHVCYLDVPLEETLRRHEDRPMRQEVPPEKLREWYHRLDVLGVPGEIVLDGRPDEDVLLARLIAEIGPVPPRADQPARASCE